MSRKREKLSPEKRLIYSPSPMHLDACRQGGRIFKNKKKYSRKGKSRFDLKKETDFY